MTRETFEILLADAYAMAARRVRHATTFADADDAVQQAAVVATERWAAGELDAMSPAEFAVWFANRARTCGQRMYRRECAAKRDSRRTVHTEEPMVAEVSRDQVAAADECDALASAFPDDVEMFNHLAAGNSLREMSRATGREYYSLRRRLARVRRLAVAD